MHRKWAVACSGRARRPASTVETIGSLYLDPSPGVFLYDGEPGAAPVVVLIAARDVKGRKREEHRAIGGVINQKVEDDVATETGYPAKRPGNLEILGELESELVVLTIEIGAPYSRSADLGAHPLPADNDPTVDRGDKETLVELATDGSL